MARIEVIPSEMRSTASRMKKASDDFLSVAGKVLSAAETLAGSWDGESKAAFINEQQRANEWYRKMMALVDAYVHNLQEASRLYEEADSESASAIRVC